MSQMTKNLTEIFTLTHFLTCNGIKLFACNVNRDALILYNGDGDFIYHNANIKNPRIKQIPWFKDPAHSPVAITFSPCGSFLLVLSISCHLYILPLASVYESNSQSDSLFNVTDLTIHVYPFSSGGLTGKDKLKGKNQVSVSNNETDHLDQTFLTTYLNDIQMWRNLTNHVKSKNLSENEIKLKEIMTMNSNVQPSAVCWWKTQKTSQEIAIIGTKSGSMIFIDLFTGLKVGETSIKGMIRNLHVCQDLSNDYTFLLVLLENSEQYRLTLEQKHVLFIGYSKHCYKEETEMSTSQEVSPVTCGNGASSSRIRLQGLKQMSVGKLATLKHKIAESRSKMVVKQNCSDESLSSTVGGSPENIGSLIGETQLSCQSIGEEVVLAGYYPPSQLLTIHSSNLELAPRSTHKMAVETEEILLCGRIIYVVSQGRTTVQVISSKLTETQIDQASKQFNQDSVLGNWNIKKRDAKSKDETGETEILVKPQNQSNVEEVILTIQKIKPKNDDFDISKVYKLNKIEGESLASPDMENCLVITNKNVYLIHLKRNIIKMALDLILEAHELEMAERICTIFGLNLQKLLELAGDIKLTAAEFPTAFALYKLSKCGLLKSIVKLACGSHCSQVLNFSLMIMTNSVSEMSLTEKIHLSNLITMAYTQQILKTENNRKLLEKFIEFLQTNVYFDEVLAVSVTGQSLLFTCLNELITRRGLILDGCSVIIKLMERHMNNKALEWSLNKKEFWTCATQINLIEAMMVKLWYFPIYAEYVVKHLDELNMDHLRRMLRLLDPTAPCLRPFARTLQNADDSSYENEECQSTFTLGQLVELFLLILLVKLNKNRIGEANYEREFVLPLRDEGSDAVQTSSQSENAESPDVLSEEIWPIRKSAKDSRNEGFCRLGSMLSSGYGHTALIRNGNVYTWGHTARGCLGQGPTMTRYSLPAPVPWLNCFRIEVSLVSCGKNHTAALTNNGVYTWGCSKYGQLGLGEVQKSPYPRLVSGLCNVTVVTLSCGQFHTLALTSQGSVFSWGWGVHGQLGLGTVEDQREPNYLMSLREHVIVDLAAGHGHSIVLSDKGHVYSFGSGVFGQLGTGTTTKFTLPTLVKGFEGKVISVATGYFHNLALTESNSLYTWGLSPQCLRFQAQARKKSKLAQNQICPSTSSSELEAAKTPTEDCLQSCSPNEFSDNSGNLDKTLVDHHLSPSLVDKRNVVGKISQISCGCHHSALVTDSGGLYTWGRSLDGQLGAGAQREIRIPTQVNESSLKVDCVSCGCEFTTAQEKRTGKIYAWGNNALGQLAMPVKESITKSLDGKLVMLKSCKRIVRLLDRNAGSNAIDSPEEISDIPSPTFTYHPLNKNLSENHKSLIVIDPEYTQGSFHFIVEKFYKCINLDYIFNKCLEYGNMQAAAKVALLQKNLKLSMIYQLKALQNSPQYRNHYASYLRDKGEDESHGGTTEGGTKTTCRTDKGDLEKLVAEYMEEAFYIVRAYLRLRSDSLYEKLERFFVIETGIQFWMAEKLPMSSLEKFFSDNYNEVFYELSFFLFGQLKDGQMMFLEQFSTDFLLGLASKILNLIKSNEGYMEYQKVMSKVLVNDRNSTANSIPKKKPKSNSYLEVVEGNLKGVWENDNYMKIPYGDINPENIYFFSCGHCHSSQGLKEEFTLFSRFNDHHLSSNLIRAYDDLIATNCQPIESACPSCVGNYFR
ncbi:hypothetical protein RUM43_008376 [Polyplax serrata]|uniref:RCC1-like domain-containing protein n=1 Tax=Polyplax serrata TaxID=468196 RepID=A0AAN8S8Z7_POLSC